MNEASESIVRVVPDEVSTTDITGQAALELHLQRYRFAAAHARPGRVLDIACGVGYGTRLLAEQASGVTEAIGVDLAQEAIQYATGRYAGGVVHFQQGDAMAFADPVGFDTIVSMETIEHLPDPAALVERLVGLLRPGGVFIASVPTTPSVDVNPYHLHDFTERSIRRLVSANGLVELAHLRQVQPFSPISILRRQEARMRDLRPGLVGYYLAHPGALARRLGSTMRYGFSNHYLCAAWQKSAQLQVSPTASG